MDEEIERLVVSVRADTAGFARDVAAMRGELGESLGNGADQAGRAIEGALLRAVKTGKFGFEDLKKTALAVLSDIAAATLRQGIGSILGNGGGRSGGGLLTALAGLLGGSPGRATGGGVVGGRPYWVGERGPELFVPAAAGRIEPVTSGGPARDVRVAITVNAAAGDVPRTLERSSRQVARAVRAALEGA